MAQLMYPGETGLLRMKRLYQKFHEEYKPKFKVIHIAGTSGKGTTALITAKILQALGLKVGVFVTPYLYEISENIQVNDMFIKPRANARAVKAVEKLASAIEVPEIGEISYFEKLTARALVHFALEDVDIAVIETAMGGLYDATNVVDSDVSVITPISIDHARLLGNNRGEVAVHKAGIIKKSNKKVVVGRQFEDVQSVIQATAAKQGVPTTILGRDFEVDNVVVSEKGTDFSYRGYGAEGNARMEDLYVSLIGAHQADNAAVAITAARALLGPSYQAEKFVKAVRKALKKVQNPGRFDIIRHKDKTIILDVAHNPEKITSVITAFQTLYPGKKVTLIFSCKWTKDAATMAKILKPITEKVFLTQFQDKNNPDKNRVMGKDELIHIFDKLDLNPIWCESPSDAMQKAMDSSLDFVLITGSFHLLRELKEQGRQL